MVLNPGFSVEQPGFFYQIAKEVSHMLKARVQEVLDKIRPSLQADGGDVELVDVTEDGIVKVKLQGACAGCPHSQMTLKNGIERLLKENIAEVQSVERA
jgi:Fe-S cluster biogenesis protein NfuA